MISAFTPPQNQMAAGFHYFVCGCRLISQRSLLPFIILPITINILIITGLIWLFLSYLSDWIDILLNITPNWLDWLGYLLMPLAFLLLIILFYFTFTTLANFIAAPFNALLAEKVESQLTGKKLKETTFGGMLSDIPRMFKREWQKICYSIPRLVALFLLGWIPALGQTMVPILTFLFSAWLLAIQYCDYPFDNHKISFMRMRHALSTNRIMNFTFGTLVSLFTVLPLVNLVIMPIAVCGATAMWVNEYRQLILNESEINREE